MANEELSGRVSKLEVKVEDHAKQLERQREKNDVQTELNTVLKLNVEQMKRFGETLDRVNENLTNLNNNQQKMNDNQLELGERVDQIETTLLEQKIDPVKLVKAIFSYLATGIGSILIAWLLWKLGISNN